MVLMLIARVPFKFFALLSGVGIIMALLLFFTADFCAAVVLVDFPRLGVLG